MTELTKSADLLREIESLKSQLNNVRNEISTIKVQKVRVEKNDTTQRITTLERDMNRLKSIVSCLILNTNESDESDDEPDNEPDYEPEKNTNEISNTSSETREMFGHDLDFQT